MNRMRGVVVWVAGGALLVAMVVDTTAMLGRQLHLPLLGAIEIVQAAVLVGAAGALLMAAVAGVHARVHLLVDRLSPRGRQWSGRANAFASALFYLALFAGSAWIAADLWSGHEESELLLIPYRPLRVLVLVTLFALFGHGLWQLFRRNPR
ncbi:MAG TPA: TRAP transporter small permease subunit [Steroidobacteraceae bacterium]|nr:TRAP transporter small permease subunit [Steroidobacteraceae bacterium]